MKKQDKYDDMIIIFIYDRIMIIILYYQHGWIHFIWSKNKKRKKRNKINLRNYFWIIVIFNIILNNCK